MQNVYTIDELEKDKSLVRHIAGGNIFDSRQYLDWYCKDDAKAYFIVSEQFLMPICVSQKYCFRYATLPVEPLEYGKSTETLQMFLDEMVLTAKVKMGIQWIQPTLASAFFMAYPQQSRRIPFGSHVIDLSQGEETIFSNFHSKHKNSVRKAERDLVVVKRGGYDLLEDYVRMDEETWERSNKSSGGLPYYKNCLDYLGENVQVFVAYLNDEPQGGAIFFYNKKMAYYIYGATKNNPHTGSMNLLHWEMIKYFKFIGVEKYSFVGCRINEDENSKYHGIQRFKERFGGELLQGYMFDVLIKPINYYLFKKLVELKSRKKYVNPIEQEIHKWKELNIEGR